MLGVLRSRVQCRVFGSVICLSSYNYPAQPAGKRSPRHVMRPSNRPKSHALAPAHPATLTLASLRRDRLVASQRIDINRLPRTSGGKQLQPSTLKYHVRLTQSTRRKQQREHQQHLAKRPIPIQQVRLVHSSISASLTRHCTIYPPTIAHLITRSPANATANTSTRAKKPPTNRSNACDATAAIARCARIISS